MLSSRRLRAGLVAGGLAACVVGLLGADGGLLWIVAGVWTVRTSWGSRPGYAWGVACLGIGGRWGSLGLGDIEAAARIFGPAATAGPIVVRSGIAVAVAAAVLSEANIDGLRSGSWALRSAGLAALLALVGVAFAPGPGHPRLETSLVWWSGAGVALVVATLALSRPTRGLPAWLTTIAATAGVATALALS